MPAGFRQVGSDEVFDLNGGDPRALALFEEWHGQLTGRHRGRFVCATADCQAPDAPVYFRKRRKTRFVCHYRGGVAHQAFTHESDEHKWKKDYVARAGEAAGFTAEKERRLRTRRPDVTISGGTITIGAEVQRSHISQPQARARTRAHAAAGVQSMWLYDGGHPEWTDAVPSLGTNDIHWDRLVDPGSWKVARGVGRIRLLPCRMDTLHRLPQGRCPAGQPRPCRQEHPVFSAEPIGRPDTKAGSAYGIRQGLSIDDIVELAPAGEIIAVKLPRQYGWVPAADAQIWAEAHGATPSHDTQERDRIRSLVAACRRAHTVPAAPPARSPLHPESDFQAVEEPWFASGSGDLSTLIPCTACGVRTFRRRGTLPIHRECEL